MIMRVGHGTPGGEMPPDPLEVAARELAKIQREHNRTPDPEMGGLTPEQVFRLCLIPWGTPGSAIQLNAGISLDSLKGSLFFQQARTLLCAVRDAGGVKATATKNLNRNFVREMAEALLSEHELAQLFTYSKAPNEEAVFCVHLARVVSQAGGLLRLAKGRFVVPKAKQALLAPERAGELYRELFVSYYVRFNLDYLSHCGPKAPAIQAYAGYSLYRLGVLAGDWQPVDGLENDALLPGVRQHAEKEIGDSPYWRVSHLFGRRILEPLVAWGLLDARREKLENLHYEVLAAVRTSSLYREFFAFDVG